MNKRIGRFVITAEFEEKNSKAVIEILKRCQPVKKYYMPEVDAFLHTAMCEEFDELNDGESIHSYVFHVSKTTVTAHRIKDLLNKDFSNGYSTIIIDE